MPVPVYMYVSNKIFLIKFQRWKFCGWPVGPQNLHPLQLWASLYAFHSALHSPNSERMVVFPWEGGGNFDISNQVRHFANGICWLNFVWTNLWQYHMSNTLGKECSHNLQIFKALVIENKIVRMLNLWHSELLILWHSEFTHLEVCTCKVISNFKSTIGTGLLVIWQKVDLLW